MPTDLRLFTPIHIATVSLRNRIVFPPMTTGYEDRGKITPRCRAFYRRIAQGGAGLIILGDVSIQASVAPTPYLYDDSFVPGLRELTSEVQSEGARIAAQLFHQEYDMKEVFSVAKAAGFKAAMRNLRLIPSWRRWLQQAKTAGREAAMQRLHEQMNDYCNHLTSEQIDAIGERFSAAARRVREAGFDMIQLHGDRLLGMFTSPLLNRRTDQYGGALENRARFALEIVRRVRDAVPDIPIEYKLAIIRTDPPLGKAGPTVEEARRLAPWLVEAGVSAFHVSLANHGGIGDTIPPMGTQPYGCFLDLAQAVKQVVDVPVTAVGRILTPELAEQVLTSGQADLVGIGRGLIAEPDWPRKVQQGQREDLRLCIMCNHCASSLMTRQPVRCAVNAEVGEPVQAALKPAAAPRRVLVAGGGPAGMEAARVAAVRGHRVTLFEREDGLGGQLALCAAPSFKEEISRLTEYLTGALRRLAVEVRTGTPLTPEALDELRPDAVIVATGARPAPLPVPADAHPNVATAWAALAGEARLGRKIVLVGGGAVGVETALYLAAPEREVTIVEMLDRVGGQESPTMLPFLERWMKEAEIRILTGHKLVEVRADAVVLEAEGEPPVVVACDTLVNAVGTTRNTVLVDEMSRRQLECHLVGDCSPTSAGTIADAIHEGHSAGAQV